MGTKTVRRLAILLGVVALLGGGGFLPLAASRWRGWPTASSRRADRGRRRRGTSPRPSELYREHLAVVPDDVEVQLKYAEAMLKKRAVGEAAGRGAGDLRGRPGSVPGRDGRAAAAAELAAEVGAVEKAREHLDDPAEGDGRGRRPSRVPDGPCHEQEGEFAGAAEVLPGPRSSTRPRSGSRPRSGWRSLLRDKLRRDRTRPTRSSRRWSSRRPRTIGSTWGGGDTAELTPATSPRGGGGRLPQGAATGPGPARGLPGGRPRGRARVGARRGPRRSSTRA